MVDSRQMAQWADARVLLEPIMSSDRPLADEAKRLYYESKRKTLMARAESGKNSRTDSKAEKTFVKAVGLKKLGQNEEAQGLFHILSYPAEPAEIDQHVQQAAMQQLEILRGEKKAEEAIAVMQKVLNRIAATEEGTTESELDRAEVLIKEMAGSKGGGSDYQKNNTRRQKVIEFATEQLIEIQKQRAELRRGKESEKEPTGGSQDSSQR